MKTALDAVCVTACQKSKEKDPVNASASVMDSLDIQTGESISRIFHSMTPLTSPFSTVIASEFSTLEYIKLKLRAIQTSNSSSFRTKTDFCTLSQD